jgi:cytosine/adenosine deaminase-related metal-dependent hydrolase
MRLSAIVSALSTLSLAAAATSNTTSTLFNGGTIVAFDRSKEALRVIRNGAVLVEGDRIAGVFDSPQSNSSAGVEVVDITGKILTTGFVDTHRHGWQTAFKTLASNTSLVEYFARYGEYVAGPFWTADDVYISQLAGLYEALNAGVTTTLDHAHHTWSNATAEAGLRACIDSGARVFWAYAFHDVPNVTSVAEQLPHFRSLYQKGDFKNSSTSLAIAYDAWAPGSQAEEVIALAK